MKKNKIFMIIAALFYLCPAAYAQSSWELSAKQCTELQGQSALDACNEALIRMPNDLSPHEYAKVYIGRGVSLGELDKDEEALLSFKKAIEFDPQNAKAYYNMGVALDNLERLHKALRAYRKSTELDGGIAETWGNLGLVAFDEGRYEEAKRAFETAQKIDPSYFNNKADQEETYKEAINNVSGNVNPAKHDSAPSETDGREFILRFTPNVGYIAKNSSNSDPILSQNGINKQLSRFVYILLNTDLDIQIRHNWFATGSFVYSHAFYKDQVDGGIDIFGVPLGIRYVLLERDYFQYEPTFIDRLRYWIGASAGPYVKNESITVDLGARDTHGSSTNVSVGVGAHMGFDYFMTPNIGLGIQVKFQYVYFDDDIIIISGGPSIIGKF